MMAIKYVINIFVIYDFIELEYSCMAMVIFCNAGLIGDHKHDQFRRSSQPYHVRCKNLIYKQGISAERCCDWSICHRNL